VEQAASLQRDIDIELPASSAKHPHEDVKDVTLIPTLAHAPKKSNGNEILKKCSSFNISRDHIVTQAEITVNVLLIYVYRKYNT
jgi:hypothetical protein